MASASDVPGRYDVVIDGHGYLLLDALAPNIPFRTHRGIYTYSPTFIERTNTTGSYGDNQQAFWLTAAQNDWSLGEGQHFFRIGDATSKRRFWRGENIDVTTEGQVRLLGAATQVTFAAAVGGAISRNGADAVCASTTHLYDVDSAGTITDLGAHGALATTSSYIAMCGDGTNIFISGNSGTIRKYNGSAFSDFSSTVAGSLCFVDNTLWGAAGSTLNYYSTAGVATQAFQWKTADGSSPTYGYGMQIRPYGGKVLVLRPGDTAVPAELWTADTTGASQVASFPATFTAKGIAVINGIVFVVGDSYKKNYGFHCEVWYYANGNTGRAYSSECYQSISPASGICEYGNGFAFIDGPNKQVMAYDLTSGSVSTIMSDGTFPNPYGGRFFLAPNSAGLLLTADVATGVVLPTAAAATSGKVISSQMDFDSSLTKLFRGVTVDWAAATDGDGGSVDILYKLNATDIGPLDLTYTTLKTGAVSGTEYLLSNITGHSISVQVTLNKGTSTNGPTLKRVYVRAAPILQTYRKREFILDLTGAPRDKPRRLRDDTSDPTIPHDGVANLVTSATSTSPISITDRFGTFTGIIEPDGFEVYEMHAEQEIQNKSGSYVVKVTVREI